MELLAEYLVELSGEFSVELSRRLAHGLRQAVCDRPLVA